MSSVRKHFTQFTHAERIFLWRELLAVEQWTASRHFKDMLHERGGNEREILDAIRESSIIEYHLRDNHSRILVRSARSFNGYVPCVVFQPKSKTIITLYWNAEKDNHLTINMGAYNRFLKVLDSWEQSA